MTSVWLSRRCSRSRHALVLPQSGNLRDHSGQHSGARRHYRAIAMDTVGFEDSGSLPFAENSIEAWSACAFGLLDALGLPQAAIIGPHTGAAIVIEMAAAKPGRIAVPNVAQAMPANRSSMMRRKARTGTICLRSGRFVGPAGDHDLLDRFMIDALKAGPLAAEGHRVVNRYAMEACLPLVHCPIQVLAPAADPHSFAVGA